jgi:putative GTP pyrophosphokinase
MAAKKKTDVASKVKFDTESSAGDYQKRYKTWENLRDEAVFIIEHELQNKNIKYHVIHKRIKTLKSALEKAQRQEKVEPFSLRDMVGIRIVCLFLSDIERVGAAIHEIFDVVTQDDKIEGQEVALFGYMSVHFIVRLKSSYSGPRYDSVKGMVFELQVRTIAMDAWAATSHYLDYKSEEDVPNSLRKDFFALSGLFYVADQHFEMFFRSRLESKKAIAKELKSPSKKIQLELNLDTLQEYLTSRFPERKAAAPIAISKLLQELKNLGYSSIEAVDSLREKQLSTALEIEKEVYPLATERAFNSVGLTRIMLDLTSESYRKSREGTESSHGGYWGVVHRHLPTK